MIKFDLDRSIEEIAFGRMRPLRFIRVDEFGNTNPKGKIPTIRQLLKMKREQISNYRRVGRKCMGDLEELLKRYGFRLEMTDKEIKIAEEESSRFHHIGFVELNSSNTYVRCSDIIAVSKRGRQSPLKTEIYLSSGAVISVSEELDEVMNKLF